MSKKIVRIIEILLNISLLISNLLLCLRLLVFCIKKNVSMRIIKLTPKKKSKSVLVIYIFFNLHFVDNGGSVVLLIILVLSMGLGLTSCGCLAVVIRWCVTRIIGATFVWTKYGVVSLCLKCSVIPVDNTCAMWCITQ